MTGAVRWIALAGLTAAVVAFGADGPPPPIAVTFSAGSTSTTLPGGGSSAPARYTIQARNRQWLEAALDAGGPVTMRLYGPGWKLERDGSVSGETELALQGSGDGKAGTYLESDGLYLLELTSPGARLLPVTLTLRPPLEENCRDLPQQPMNRCFAAVAAEADTARARAYGALEARLGATERDLLAVAEGAWRNYAEASCRFQSTGFEGGTMRPTVYWSCMARFTRDRQAELERTPDGQQ